MEDYFDSAYYFGADAGIFGQGSQIPSLMFRTALSGITVFQRAGVCKCCWMNEVVHHSVCCRVYLVRFFFLSLSLSLPLALLLAFPLAFPLALFSSHSLSLLLSSSIHLHLCVSVSVLCLCVCVSLSHTLFLSRALSSSLSLFLYTSRSLCFTPSSRSMSCFVFLRHIMSIMTRVSVQRGTSASRPTASITRTPSSLTVRPLYSTAMLFFVHALRNGLSGARFWFSLPGRKCSTCTVCYWRRFRLWFD